MKTGAETPGETLIEKNGCHTVVVKSTVGPRTTVDTLPILADSSNKTVGDDLGVGMNPKFLHEGVQFMISSTRIRSCSARTTSARVT